MPDLEFLEIEVAYARPDQQRVVALRVAAGCSVREALLQSGLGDEFPEIDFRHCPVGVFGREIDDEYVIRSGDRLEIYRPLELDPRNARRKRAARGLTM